METASKESEYEKAEKIKKRIFALQHIQDIALITEPELINKGKYISRVEGYDISNISGTSAVGSMAVFIGGEPIKSEYRKFKIRTIKKQNDVGMLREVLKRRFKHIPPASGWPLPSLILVDGGKAQVNAAILVLKEAGLKIPIVGVAKGSERKKNEFIGTVPKGIDKKALIRLRNEAHRFAITYHRRLRDIYSK